MRRDGTIRSASPSRTFAFNRKEPSVDYIDESRDIGPHPDQVPGIETVVQFIIEEIDRRTDSSEHPLKRYQIVSSADQGRIWIASAVGPCLDLRYTPLEIGPEQAWTWHCEDPDVDACDVGWKISTPAEIVDLLAEVVGCE